MPRQRVDRLKSRSCPVGALICLADTPVKYYVDNVHVTLYKQLAIEGPRSVSQGQRTSQSVVKPSECLLIDSGGNIYRSGGVRYMPFLKCWQSFLLAIKVRAMSRFATVHVPMH